MISKNFPTELPKCQSYQDLQCSSDFNLSKSIGTTKPHMANVLRIILIISHIIINNWICTKGRMSFDNIFKKLCNGIKLAWISAIIVCHTNGSTQDLIS